jgi:orotate phosphoribosyltransferase
VTIVDEEKKKLLRLIRFHATLKAEPGTLFTLAGGARTDTYIDIKRASMRSNMQLLLAQNLHDALVHFFPVDAVAGVVLGGCHLASIVALHAAELMQRFGGLTGSPEKSLDVLYIRKEKSDHGLQNIVEGPVSKGMRVVLCEDVVTTGGSSMKAVGHLRDVGCEIQGVLGVIDRRREASEALPDGTRVRALFTLDELLYDGIDMKTGEPLR